MVGFLDSELTPSSSLAGIPLQAVPSVQVGKRWQQVLVVAVPRNLRPKRIGSEVLNEFRRGPARNNLVQQPLGRMCV